MNHSWKYLKVLNMKTIIISLVFLSSLSISQAQSVLNAKSPEDLRKMREKGVDIGANGDTIKVKKDALPYGFIEQKDVMWSRTVWEIIDLNEKLNQPLYYNSNSLVQKHNSIYQVLFDAINSGKIKEVYEDEYFSTKIKPEDIQRKIKFVRESDALKDSINAGVTITDEMRKELTDVFTVDNSEVKLIKIKGMWYMDKRLGEMKYRILGICPMGPDPSTKGQMFYNQDELVDLFWVWYPDAREVLANEIVFNPKNNSSDISYDDIFNARRFSSIIYKTENGQGSGTLEEYLPKDALEQIKEHQRIKQSILAAENDMWNY